MNEVAVLSRWLRVYEPERVSNTTITTESATIAVSEEIALGWSDNLAFVTPFTIQSIVSMNPDSVVLLNGTLSFTTPKKPDPLPLFVDGRTGEASRFCGESTRPCLSVEVGWEIVAQLGVRRPTIGIVDSATLGSPIRVENGMVALLSNFGNVDPSLRIPSSACDHVESGMIVVSSSILEIRDVDIVMNSLSPSFVLLSAMNSNLTLKEGSFVGPQSTPSSNDELSNEICSWTSGIVQLDNCTTSISDMKLTHLSFGAINMRNGSLEVVTSSFHANSPNLPSYPSLRRNIHCSDGGHIEIGSLTGGDGVGDKMGWFSRSDCTLSGDGVNIETAFFAPTLNTDASQTTFTKKTGTFEIEIVGTVLIPCGLLLEVFELTKDKKEGSQLQFELNLDSTQSFTEKNIRLAISQVSLKELKGELEWRGRLVFGESSKTVETILIQKNVYERLVDSILMCLIWILPVMILVLCVLFVVIVVVYYRRRKKQELARARTSLTNFSICSNEDQIERQMCVGVDGLREETIVEGLRLSRPSTSSEMLTLHTTLFDVLHSDGCLVSKRETEELIVSGLAVLEASGMNMDVLSIVNTRILVFNEEMELFLQLSDLKMLEGEGLRWGGPEEGLAGSGSDCESDRQKALVFRVGMMLWEIETGEVPFGQLDALNAHLNVMMGMVPDLESVGSVSMRRLIAECLERDPTARPTLPMIVSELKGMTEGRKKEEDGDENGECGS
ncbi:hypothetical protein BLNAU_20579 [Blattamonas nauphoetae]|uniref:Protein kinase domain-containing protein n=1 Tax=Blattamonas nauphoetae TaxID=2049346 RepID=A0ABQ9WYE5_9EUKA|nr:hypothetical protein BLNAU_20579 [Blattamonas nauphoetae]